MKTGVVLMMILFTGCSTAPKRPLEIRNMRNAAAAQLELLNREADRGNYSGALEMMAQTWSMAVASDDPVLLVKAGLSRGNILFFLGRVDESDQALAEASAFAEETGSRELIAASIIYLERQRLLKAAGQGDEAVALSVRDRVRRELGAVKEDLLAAALGWNVAGLAEKELRRYAEAEAAFRNALEIHDKGRYLEQAAYDWYLIASARSLSGRYDHALAALEEALSYDRRAENSFGLGSDWSARGEIYLKMGDLPAAAGAFRRAAAIFSHSGAEEAALKAARQAEAAEPNGLDILKKSL